MRATKHEGMSQPSVRYTSGIRAPFLHSTAFSFCFFLVAPSLCAQLITTQESVPTAQAVAIAHPPKPDGTLLTAGTDADRFSFLSISSVTLRGCCCSLIIASAHRQNLTRVTGEERIGRSTP